MKKAFKKTTFSKNVLFWFRRRLYVWPYILSLLKQLATRRLVICILLNFTWQEYRSYFWWKSEYRVISEPREYTAQVSFSRLKTKSERSIKAGFFIPLETLGLLGSKEKYWQWSTTLVSMTCLFYDFFFVGRPCAGCVRCCTRTRRPSSTSRWGSGGRTIPASWWWDMLALSYSSEGSPALAVFRPHYL